MAEAESAQALRDAVSSFRGGGDRELEAASRELETASHELDAARPRRMLGEALAAQTQWERAVGVVEAAGIAHASAVARFTQLQVRF